MNWLRWQTFKFLSTIGWRICPEPQRSTIKAIMPGWGAIDEAQMEGDLQNAVQDINFGAGK